MSEEPKGRQHEPPYQRRKILTGVVIKQIISELQSQVLRSRAEAGTDK